ncbi:hypothetical protein [Candidatus Uabimicrobium sp. HlEnr_7]|uniref:hypothetical protein n=1 Tax=Candidatus Uabimicrobium helgolandensis TaxID=3095367 RepID=UPI003555F1D6
MTKVKDFSQIDNPSFTVDLNHLKKRPISDIDNQNSSIKKIELSGKSSFLGYTIVWIPNPIIAWFNTKSIITR